MHTCICVLGRSLYVLNFEAVLLVERTKRYKRKKVQWDPSPRLWVEGLGIEPHLPVLKPLRAKPQTQGDTWPFCNFFTISSKSSVFSDDSVWPVEWKPELQHAVRVTGDWGKVHTCLGREEESLSRFWEHPGLNQGSVEGQPPSRSRVPTGPPSFVPEAKGVRWVNQNLYWSVLPRRLQDTTLSKIQGWEKMRHFSCCCSQSVWNCRQCDRPEWFHRNFLPIIVGHYLQILKEVMGLGHGLAMAANIHKRHLDIVSLLMEEHNTTCEGLCSLSPNPNQEKKKKGWDTIRFPFLQLKDIKLYLNKSRGPPCSWMVFSQRDIINLINIILFKIPTGFLLCM